MKRDNEIMAVNNVSDAEERERKPREEGFCREEQRPTALGGREEKAWLASACAALFHGYLLPTYSWRLRPSKAR